MKKIISVLLFGALVLSLLTACGATIDGSLTEIGDKYTGAGDFSEGLAAVKKDGLWGYIDTDGNYAVEPKFYSAWAFSEGLAAVQTHGQYHTE